MFASQSQTNPSGINRQLAFAGMMLLLLLVFAAQVVAKDEAGEVDADGLELRDVSGLRKVYALPGATLRPYKRIALLDCFVEFEKNWQKNYNSTVRRSGQRINEKDIARIKNEVAAEFRKVFTQELETKGGYEIVDSAGPDVLVLRPAIINLSVTAPDKMTPGISTTIVDSAGQMTLYLELYDAETDKLIAKVIDQRTARSTGGFGVSNSVTNKAEADRIMRRWADILRSHLDTAHSSSPATSGAAG